MSTKDLTILPIKQVQDDDPKWDSIDPRLPKPPFVIVLTAPPSSGKSVTIINMIYNENFYREKFDNIVVISPTVENDATWQIALQDESLTIITGDLINDVDSVIDRIHKIQRDKVKLATDEGRPMPHLLIILDDCVGFLKKGFAHLCTRHRHARISVLVTTQDFRSIPIITRQCASHYIIYRTHSNIELGKIIEEFGGQFGNERLLELYNECTKEQYSFMVLDKRNVKVYKKFGTMVYSREDDEN